MSEVTGGDVESDGGEGVDGLSDWEVRAGHERGLRDKGGEQEDEESGVRRSETVHPVTNPIPYIHI